MMTPYTTLQTAPAAEIVTFRLNPGVSDTAFAKAAAQTTPFLRATGQVLSRVLSRDADGLWTDHITWTSMQAALETAELAMKHADFAPMMSMISGPEVVLRHAPVMLQMD